MRTARRHVLLLGALLGPLPLLIDLVVTQSGKPLIQVPLYLLYSTSAVSVLLLTCWLRSLRATEDIRTKRTLLWTAVVLSTLVAAFALSFMSGYASTELHDRQTYALMPGVLAAAGVATAQTLLATVMLLTPKAEQRTARQGITLVTALAVLAALGTTAEHTTRSLHPSVEHVTTGGDHAPLGVPTQVGDTVHTLNIPQDTVEALLPISSGILLELVDGVMAVDPHTGEELWRYRHPGAQAASQISFDMETVVIEVAPPWSSEEPDPLTTRVTVDANSGRLLHSVQDRQRLLGEKVSSIVSETPPFEGESVVVEAEGGLPLRVFGASSGAFLWEFHESPECTPDTSRSEQSVNSLVLTDEIIFASIYCLDDNGEAPERLTAIVHAMEASTGDLLWTHEIDNADYSMAGIVATSWDGSLLYRYEPNAETYFTIDTATGREVSTGKWEGSYPYKGIWDSVMGEGVLLGKELSLTLTNTHGVPRYTLDLPTPEGNEKHAVTDEALYTVEQADGAGPVTLTAHPWDGSGTRTVENVLGRDLAPKEGLGIRVVPGAVVVHTQQSGVITSAVAIT